MDLIEDEPRKHPKPVPFCQDSLLQPTVPEVSLVLQEKLDEEKKNDSFSGMEFQTYNVWRWKHLRAKEVEDNVRITQNTKSRDYHLLNDKYSCSDIEKRKNEILYGHLDEPRRPLPPRPSPVIPKCVESFFNTSFEDFSLGKEEVKENYIPLQSDVSNRITHHHNKKTNSRSFEKEIDNSEKLYNIISEQNKQTEVLQKQIEQLLKLQDVKDRQIEQLLKSQENKEKKIQQLLQSLSTKDREMEQLLKLKNKQESQLEELIKSNSDKQSENLNLLRKLKEIQRKDVCSKETMTSYEVAEASTNTSFEFSTTNQREQIQDANISCVRDLSETNDADGKDKSLSLHLSDLPPVPEHMPTPQSSIHVDIQDFHDSSDDDNEGGTLSNNFPTAMGSYSNNLGYTFYNNVLTQVKDIIQSSGEKNNQRTKESLTLSDKGGAVKSFHAWGVFERENRPTMIEAGRNDSVERCHFESSNLGKDSSPSDISLKINALAMKYLKQEQISQYDIPPQIPNPCQGDVTIYNVTNLSFGSMRYLDRYKILPKAKDQQDANVQQKDFSPAKLLQKKKKMAVQENFDSSIGNILDISALNQQPKLL